MYHFTCNLWILQWYTSNFSLLSLVLLWSHICFYICYIPPYLDTFLSLAIGYVLQQLNISQKKPFIFAKSMQVDISMSLTLFPVLENFFKLFFFFLPFLGPHPWHMGVPRLGVQLDLLLPAYARATATSVTYTTAHCNAGSLTH